jgi:cellobiose transport system permease protein
MSTATPADTRPSTMEATDAARRRRRRRPAGQAPSDAPASWFTYAVLAVVIFISAFPLYWSLVLASSTDQEMAKPVPNLIPGDNLLSNIRKVLDPEQAQNVFFLKSMWNSIIVTVIVTLSVLFFCSLAGFAFAKLRFRGRNALFLFLVATMTIPSQVGLVALYIWMNNFHLNGTLWAVIVPGLVTAFGVFLMRQYIQDAIPDELIEAARVDGASTWRIYLLLVVPSIRPIAGVLGLFTFIQTWNDYQWPLITLKGGTDNTYTIQVALSNLATGVNVDYSRLMAGSLMATIPLLIIFLLAGKQIVGGIMEGAVKS